MNRDDAARRWAEALLALDTERRGAGRLAEEVEAAARVYASNAELRRTLENPMLPAGTRSRIWRVVLSRLDLSTTANNALWLMANKDRLPFLVKTAQTLRRLVDERDGVARCEVTSADAVDPATRARIAAALERRTGRTVVVAWREDPALLAGLVVHVGTLVLDGSLGGALSRIRERARLDAAMEA